ncbi:MAG: putative N-acetylmannosamine-6-phosphate 2-epimerase [Caldithrix sp.]|nr:putative N-acetylmannosamine-6-phosphate 2-epimerase [Caldithrix sp.]
MNRSQILSRIKNGIIVSCQSEPPEPLAKPEILTAMARAAVMGGAVGIRANGPPNIRAMRKALDVPIIGINKQDYEDAAVRITPTTKELKAVIQTGSDIIAMDATHRKRPGNQTLQTLVDMARSTSDALLMADIATLEEGIMAAKMGFDLIATTLSGYTEESQERLQQESPDFKLLSDLVNTLQMPVPVIAEGRIWHPQEARKAIETGAFAVVVGTAITRPWAITRRFADALS